MRIHLTFNQQARLFSWLQQNAEACMRVTGHNPIIYLSKLIAPRDLGRLPIAHADFPPNAQWWVDKHCPYGFAKSGKAKRHILLSIKDWYYRKIKKA